ncbi:hypothetical protein chiPu_0015728 [Chiloscyllium punctatum]|uniref:Uncharacterized protein n=1 Tax=Chiloscyllium punctatum TaxID=137246 RepID=A0A401T3I3_CHIPU|nr:hypothetical protein [Chiloscyllium punctatum]
MPVVVPSPLQERGGKVSSGESSCRAAGRRVQPEPLTAGGASALPRAVPFGRGVRAEPLIGRGGGNCQGFKRVGWCLAARAQPGGRLRASFNGGGQGEEPALAAHVSVPMVGYFSVGNARFEITSL